MTEHLLIDSNPEMATRRKQLVGQTFGRLTVLAPTARKNRRHWLCVCSCGKETIVATWKLCSGWTKSCGCLQKDHPSATTHGESRGGKCTPRLKMFLAAKSRSKKAGIPFHLKLDDIQIPDKCPILGIPLKAHEGRCDFDSPSLDQIIPGKGYEPGNIQVISHKANTIKSNASLKELRAVVDYMENLQRERLSEDAPKRVKQ